MAMPVHGIEVEDIDGLGEFGEFCVRSSPVRLNAGIVSTKRLPLSLHGVFLIVLKLIALP